MTFDEYLGRFRLLQHALERDERSIGLMESAAYASFSMRFGNAKDPRLRGYAREAERIKERLARRRRLCERYAARLALAVSKIPSGELQEYARYHYLYGLTHEEFSEVSFYSVRTVYRIARKAKAAMTEKLLEVSPKICRIKPAKFRIKGSLRQKSYHLGKEARSVATLTARRKSEPYRTLLFPW